MCMKSKLIKEKEMFERALQTKLNLKSLKWNFDNWQVQLFANNQKVKCCQNKIKIIELQIYDILEDNKDFYT